MTPITPNPKPQTPNIHNRLTSTVDFPTQETVRSTTQQVAAYSSAAELSSLLTCCVL